MSSEIDLLTAKFLATEPEHIEFYTELAAGFREGYLYVERTEPLLASPYIIQRDGRVYFKRAYDLLVELQRLYQCHCRDLPPAFVCTERLAELLPEQQKAVEQAAKHRLWCIWGGPGTGKTYTAGWFVKLYVENNPDARIVLTAPTGKAAFNLHESIKRACPGSCLEAKTLHALLGLKRTAAWQKTEPLPYDLIVVDESSMIDLSMFVKLLSSLSNETRILFLGDPNQLPPIEPGEPFVALVNEKVGSGLVTPKRQESDTIIQLANAVKEADVEKAMRLVDLKPLTAFKDVKQLYSTANQTIESFFAELLTKRVLSPQRIGPYGTIALNQELRASAKAQTLIPIIITKNDYTLGLTNGQVGILSGDYAYFDGQKTIPQLLLASYEQAYALSVHKSQGSEFGEVHLLLPPGSEQFGRNMLYTAITRAKKKLTIYSSLDTLAACITTPSRSCTTHLRINAATE